MELARHVRLLQRGNDSLHETVGKLRQQTESAPVSCGVAVAGRGAASATAMGTSTSDVADAQIDRFVGA